jgi:hypothetical protein
MLVSSGKNNDTQWFDYRPEFFQPVVRVEWDSDTMYVALPVDTANYLLGRGYARAMTDAEIEEYTSPPKPEPEPPARKSKKGDPA